MFFRLTIVALLLIIVVSIWPVLQALFEVFGSPRKEGLFGGFFFLWVAVQIRKAHNATFG